MLREVLQQDDPAIVVPDLVLYEVLRQRQVTQA